MTGVQTCALPIWSDDFGGREGDFEAGPVFEAEAESRRDLVDAATQDGRFAVVPHFNKAAGHDAAWLGAWLEQKLRGERHGEDDNYKKAHGGVSDVSVMRWASECEEIYAAREALLTALVFHLDIGYAEIQNCHATISRESSPQRRKPANREGGRRRSGAGLYRGDAGLEK